MFKNTILSNTQKKKIQVKISEKKSTINFLEDKLRSAAHRYKEKLKGEYSVTDFQVTPREGAEVKTNEKVSVPES